MVAFVLTAGSVTLGYIVAGGIHNADPLETDLSGLPVQTFQGMPNTSQDATKQIAPVKLESFLDNSQFDSLLTRTHLLYEFFANVDKETIQEYWKYTQHLHASNERKHIQRVMIQAWSTVDPVAALAVIEREILDDTRAPLMELVFREWSLVNLADAMNYMGNLDLEDKLRAVSSIVRSREDLSYQQRREIARELDCEWVALEVLRKSTDAFVIEDPAQEWTSFVWKNKDDLQTLSDSQEKMLANLAYSWIVQDGVVAFEKMRHTLPSNFSLLTTAKYVSTEIFETNPQLAFDLALTGTRRERELEYLQLAVDLVAKWAATDGRTALDATDAIIARAFQQRLRRRVLWVWAQTNPQSLLNSIDELPQSLQLKAQETSLTYIAKQSPERVRSMLSEINDRKYRNVVAKAVVKSWALTDLGRTLDWIQSDERLADIRVDLTRTAYFSLGRVNPKLAVETAVTQPLRESKEGWEALVIDWTANDNLDVAANLLPLVRQGRTRTRAYDAVIARSIEEHEWERAINLIVLYEDNKGYALGSYVGTLAREVPTRLYEKLETMDSPWLRKSIAWQLHAINKENSVFSSEQLELLEEISEAPTPQRPSRKPSARSQEALDNFNRVYQEEQSD